MGERLGIETPAGRASVQSSTHLQAHGVCLCVCTRPCEGLAKCMSACTRGYKLVHLFASTSSRESSWPTRPLSTTTICGSALRGPRRPGVS